MRTARGAWQLPAQSPFRTEAWSASCIANVINKKTEKGYAMQNSTRTSTQTSAQPPAANAVYLALKGLAYVAELGMIGGILYAAWTAGRYWPSIGV